MIREFVGGNIFLEIVISFTIIGLAFLPAISLVAMFGIWWERKIAAHMQSRLGPMEVGLWHGWAQSIADGMKLLLKEDLTPRGADVLLFKLAPYVAFAPVFAAWLALPWGPVWVFEPRLNIGVLYLLAFLAVEAIAVIMAGWASNSKWALYGAMRQACQIVAYEVPMGLSILAGVLVAGTLNLVDLGFLQGGGMWDWFLHANPMMPLVFLIFFVSSLASNKRAPFDLAESESELVAGFHTEYSGLRWSMFFFAEYGAMFVVGAIQVGLFLGSWNSPLGVWDPVYRALGYDPIHAGLQHFTGSIASATTWQAKAQVMGVSPLGLLVLSVYSLAWFVFKTMAIVFVQIWIRWTLPRVRIDQVLHACVKVLLPASLVLLLAVGAWVWLVPQMPAVLVSGVAHNNLGHLAYPSAKLAAPLQLACQVMLSLLSLALVGFCVGVVAWAWVHRSAMPRKTLFPDVMPVGDRVAFTPSFGSATDRR
jgi:NADH-quinone oxidoreductase subunit H